MHSCMHGKGATNSTVYLLSVHPHESLNYMAKCNLGKFNVKSMRPVVFPTNLHVEWPQGFALPCADKSAIFAICFALLSSRISMLLCWQIYYPALPTLIGSQKRVSTVLGKVFPLKFLQCDGAGWWLPAGRVPAHRVAMETSLLCLILAWGPHQPPLAPVPKLIYW